MTNHTDSQIDHAKQSQTGSSRTWDIGQAAFKLITQHNTSADPVSYAVWYAYASDNKPDLNKALDDILSHERGVTSAEIQQLHADHVKEDTDAEEKLEAFSRAIQSEVAGAQSLVTDIISNADDYASSIGKAKEMLPDTPSDDDLKEVIDEIVEESERSKKSAQDIQVALQNKHEEIIELSSRVVKFRDTLMRDSLTQLINRQKFETLLEERSSEALANGYSMTVLVASVENILDLNQKASADISEFILKSFSRVMKKSVGAKGVCARFSGSEFGVMMPGSAYMEAGKVARSIMKELESNKVVQKQSGQSIGHIQCAFGGAALRPGLSAEDLINLATLQNQHARATDRSAIKFDLTHQSAA